MDTFERTLSDLVSNIDLLDKRISHLETADEQGGSLFVRAISTNSDYNASTDDCYIGINDTSTSRTVRLPAAGANLMGMVIVIKDESGGASVNPIIINGNGALIDGSSARIINTNYGVLRVIYSGTAWFIV